MNPGKAPWLFKAKKMMEDWKGYKVADHFVFSTITAFSEVLGHYMGNYPAVTIQDFALAKELFNRLYNIDERSLDLEKTQKCRIQGCYSSKMIITVFSGRSGAGEARQLFHDI